MVRMGRSMGQLWTRKRSGRPSMYASIGAVNALRRMDGKRPLNSRQTSKFRRVMSGRVRSAPVAQGVVSAPKGAVTVNRGKSIVVSNREYIGDVTTTAGVSTFKVAYNAYINPSNTSMFLWLATIAGHFESYKIRKLVVTYEPATTSATCGQVMLSPDYDPADEAPTTWSAAACQKGSVHGAAWSPLVLNCNTKELNRRVHYTTTANVPTANADLRDVHAGKIYCIIENISNAGTAFAGATAIGKLYVSYTVELIEPEYGNTLVADGSGAGVRYNLVGTGLTTGAQIVNANWSLAAGSWNATFDTTNNRLYFNQAAEYIFVFTHTYSAPQAWTNPALASVGSYNCTLTTVSTTLFDGGTGYTSVMLVQCTSPDGYLKLQMPTWAGVQTCTGCGLRFAPYPTAFG